MKRKLKRTSVRHDDDDVVTAFLFTPFATNGINKFLKYCSILLETVTEAKKNIVASTLSFTE